MPEFVPPGVYVEETGTAPQPIEGVATSVAGFVGPTERGPEDIRYIASWSEFYQWFGGHLGVHKSYLSYAVQGFFDNGGNQCVVGRVVKGAANSITVSTASLLLDAAASVEFLACGRGEWGNNILVRVTESSRANQQIEEATNWVRVQVLYFLGSTPPDSTNVADPFNPNPQADVGKRQPEVVEDFDKLSLVKSDSNFMAAVINARSKLVRVRISENPQAPTETQFRPLTGGVGSSWGVSDLEDYSGDLGPNLESDSESLLVRGRGLLGMEAVDEVALVMAPDHVRLSGLAEKLIASCTKCKDRLAILSTNRNTQTNVRLNIDSNFGAIYHPWIWVYDTVTQSDQLIPATGHIAGIIARTDMQQGVHKAPANAVVIGADGLEKQISQADLGILNTKGVNCIRDFRASSRGIRLWGARTMSSDPEWRYISVRRLFLFIEKSIDRGIQWAVFELNHEATWARVRELIFKFLMTVWRNGGLIGRTADDAFFVKCDRTTMSEDDILNGRLVCQIGISPVRPAEFVIFRIVKQTGDAPA